MKVAVNHWLNQTTMTTMMILAMKGWIGTSWRRKLAADEDASDGDRKRKRR